MDKNCNMIANKRMLNDSDDFTIINPSKARKKSHTTSREQTEMEENTARQRMITNDKKESFPVNHLQRAITSNLPCFTISFQSGAKGPAAVSAADELYNFFEQNKIKINNNFSVVRYIGNHLKIGVNNKEDYLTLCNSNSWPTEIQNKKITIKYPKFTPEQFSLVIRYIPKELSIEQIEQEVRLSANTADNFREIHYSYQRSTNHFRFTASDIKEYNGLLQLKHIGVGNRMRLGTPYKPANKLTYCIKCWKLGHVRHDCNVPTQRCKICLLNYDSNHNKECSKQLKCAQCNQDHHSLDPNCLIVQDYQSNLNHAVKEAMERGQIKRNTVYEEQ